MKGRIFHKIAHLLKINNCHVLSWTNDGKTWIGFRCFCGVIQDKNPARQITKTIKRKAYLSIIKFLKGEAEL